MVEAKEAKVKRIVAICGCGKELSAGEVKGSAQHPYCAKCFKEDWHDDEKAYMNWLITHD